jgi:hypothetical protein
LKNLSLKKKFMEHEYRLLRKHHLELGSLISSQTHSGNVYNAHFKGQPVVVKKVLLSSGLHHTHHRFRDKNGDQLLTSEAEKLFKSHRDGSTFLRRSSKSLSTFRKEGRNLRKMSRQLAPKVYHTVIDQSGDIHFGYLVLEKCDSTLLELLLERDLNRHEERIVKRAINKLHDHGFGYPQSISQTETNQQEKVGKWKRYSQVNTLKKKGTVPLFLLTCHGTQKEPQDCVWRVCPNLYI